MDMFQFNSYCSMAHDQVPNYPPTYGIPPRVSSLGYLVFKAITTLMRFQKHAFSFRVSTLKCTKTTEFHAVTQLNSMRMLQTHAPAIFSVNVVDRPD